MKTYLICTNNKKPGSILARGSKDENIDGRIGFSRSVKGVLRLQRVYMGSINRKAMHKNLLHKQLNDKVLLKKSYLYYEHPSNEFTAL